MKKYLFLCAFASILITHKSYTAEKPKTYTNVMVLTDENPTREQLADTCLFFPSAHHYKEYINLNDELQSKGLDTIFTDIDYIYVENSKLLKETIKTLNSIQNPIKKHIVVIMNDPSYEELYDVDIADHIRPLIFRHNESSHAPSLLGQIVPEVPIVPYHTCSNYKSLEYRYAAGNIGYITTRTDITLNRVLEHYDTIKKEHSIKAKNHNLRGDIILFGSLFGSIFLVSYILATSGILDDYVKGMIFALAFIL